MAEKRVRVDEYLAQGLAIEEPYEGYQTSEPDHLGMVNVEIDGEDRGRKLHESWLEEISDKPK